MLRSVQLRDAHGGFLDGVEVGGYGHEGGHEGVEVWVALGTGLRRKYV